ncbi:hypothetical protein EPO17_03065 [Patescibacteria group bacterium]|nr:MAG: hypothetical protein EPO17_03065 [Patescibacteria group bacterium]
MTENISTPTTSPAPHKKNATCSRFFKLFGHDARQDWLLLLCFSGLVLVAFLIFAIWTYTRVHAGKAFSFETEPVSLPSITVNTEELAKTIEMFEQKKLKFNSIRQIGVDASDPSL